MKTRVPLFAVISVWCILALVAPAHGDDLQDQLSNAFSEIRVFNFGEAYKMYSDILPRTEKGSELWQEVTFCKAVCAQQRTPLQQESINEAKALYQSILDDTPTSRFAPRCTMNIGRIYELQDFHGDKVDLEKARAFYLNTIDRWPHARIASEAAVRVAGTYIQTYQSNQVVKGIRFLEKWLDDHPEDPLAPVMWQYLGNTYMYPVENYEQAVRSYMMADDLGILTKSTRGMIYWNIAQMAENQMSNRNIAVQYYTKIITDEPTSGKAYEAQIALRRLGAPVPEITIFKSRKDISPADAESK